MTIKRLRELFAAAREPDRWGVVRGNQICIVDESGNLAPRTGMRPAGDPYPQIARMAGDYSPDHNNAALIVAAVNALPALLDVIEAARALDEDGTPTEAWNKIMDAITVFDTKDESLG